MERLTKKTENGYVLEFPQDKTISDLEIKFAVYDKLGAYEDAEENGLLIKLPVPIGSPVYVITENLLTSTIKTIEFEGHEYHRHIPNYIIGKCPFTITMLSKIGKTVFLSREEAEQALKQMGE